MGGCCLWLIRETENRAMAGVSHPEALPSVPKSLGKEAQNAHRVLGGGLVPATFSALDAGYRKSASNISAIGSVRHVVSSLLGLVQPRV